MPEGRPIIAYCGLYRNECFSYTGKIADFARDLRKELRQERFDKTAESLLLFRFLRVNNGDVHIKNLRKIKKKGKEEFLKGKKYWYSKIKS